MPNFLIGVVTTCYAYVGLTELLQSHYGWSLVWLAYAVANIGLLLAMKGF